jgi:S1-C subfamily serine protease
MLLCDRLSARRIIAFDRGGKCVANPIFLLAVHLNFCLECSGYRGERNFAKYVGEVTWVENIKVNQEEKSVIHRGSCVAVDIGSKAKENDRLLLTAAHVVKGTDRAVVRIQDKEFIARVLLAKPEQDVAYLLAPIEIKDLDQAPIQDLVYSFKDTYSAVGYTEGKQIVMAGSVKDYNEYKVDERNIDGKVVNTFKVSAMKFSSPCEAGMSGGGVFDKEGRLKGIIIAANKEYSLFIPWGKLVGEDKKK